MTATAPPPAGRVAIIIDDLGYDPHALAGLGALPAPLTVSVIPAQKWSREMALRAARLGYQVMIHLPMEPLRYPGDQPRLDTVEVGMGPPEVARLVDAAIADVPGAVGLNNHMGSRATRSPALMREVLRLAKANGLFFIDSRTTSRSVAYETARELGVRAGWREVFLDSVRSPALIRRQLRHLMSLARRQGGAIGIGHPFPETLEAVREAIPEMEAQGIALVYAGQLTRY
jgi:polysaccharide deacetylase 2 family uncharacterized protein YibQ